MLSTENEWESDEVMLTPNLECPIVSIPRNQPDELNAKRAVGQGRRDRRSRYVWNEPRDPPQERSGEYSVGPGKLNQNSIG